jgi:antitoxin FitA
MKTIQVGNVPDDVHRALRARAAAAGVSLSDFALAELEPLPAIHPSSIFSLGHIPAPAARGANRSSPPFDPAASATEPPCWSSTAWPSSRR